MKMNKILNQLFQNPWNEQCFFFNLFQTIEHFQKIEFFKMA